MQQKLPPVAKSVYVNCTKCNVDRYHRVIAHTSDSSAKVECEVCKKKRVYKLESPKPASVSKSASAKSKTGGASRTSSKQSYSAKFDSIKEQMEAANAVPYSIKTKFEHRQVIKHPSFGLGLVLNVQTDRIEVMFETEVKNLVHNRV